jgi:hypothetical protein
VFPLAAQPTKKAPFQQRRVEPVGLGPAMFARDGDTVWVDDIPFDAVRPQPTGQPEAVAPCLEGDRDPADVAAGRLCLFASGMQQPQQRRLIRLKLLCRVSLDPRNNPGDEPTRLTHLDSPRSTYYSHQERRAICSGHSAAA